MNDDGFADPPTEMTGIDRGTHRGWGCVLVVLINALAWTTVVLMVKSCGT